MSGYVRMCVGWREERGGRTRFAVCGVRVRGFVFVFGAY
jgi:hypothetical protein